MITFAMTLCALRAASILCLIPALLPVFAPAQSGSPAPMSPMPNPDPRLATLHAKMTGVHTPSSVALSSDGALVAWAVRSPTGSQIHLTDPHSADPTKGKIIASNSGCSDSAPAWAPDAAFLAYTSTCTPTSSGSTSKSDPQPQIFLYSRASGKSQQLTHLTGIFEDAHWSPDGRSLAFLFVENATRSAGALAAMKPWSGVIGEDGIEVQRIASVSVPDGTFRFITPANLHVFEYDWSPKSDAVTYTAAAPPGENNWWVAQLYTQFLGTQSSSPKPVSILNTSSTPGELHDLQIAQPAWSPDGKRIAFIGGLMSDQGSTGGDIFTLPATGGSAPRNVSPDHTVSPSWIEWLSPSVIRTVARKGGGNLITSWNIDVPTATSSNLQGDPSSKFTLKGVNSATGGVSSDHAGDYAFSSSSFDSPPEVFFQPVGSAPLQQVTHLNDTLKPAWGKAESIEWTNDGFNVQGWLMYPVDYDPQRKYPLLVIIHGGPSAAIGAHWGSGGANFSALGYFVFSPNPRGSYGQGEKFTAANVKDFGYGDLRDILAGMDVIEKKVSIDTHREGIGGWSYGGFMTMFAVTQTHRFRAAFAGAGISDWKSYYGENSIDQWMLPFFGKTVYDDPAVYAKSSAIEFIKNVQTPTLIVVGDRDGECPAPQSFEFFHALRARGVKTQLVVYPNEGHGFQDPAHIRDLEAREVAWFAHYMPGEQTSAEHTPAKTQTAIQTGTP